MRSKLTKAIFPVAGLGTRFLPATKDVCIMAFLGLHDLSRRIFQSAAI